VLVMLIKAELDHQVSKAFQISPVSAVRMINNDDALLLDVREPAEYGRGHIQDARNIPFSSLKEKLNGIMQYKDKPVLAYCGSGVVSGRACKTLKHAGFSNVHNLEGGLVSWQDAKLPLTNKT